MTENTATPDPDVITADESGASSLVETGYLSGPGFDDVPVRYSVHDGHAFYQGCIDMGPVEAVRARTEEVRQAQPVGLPLGGPDPTGTDPEGAALDGTDLELQGIGLAPTSSKLWTNGVVPYVIEGTLPDQQRVHDAIAHLRDNTPIRFVPRDGQADYVRFVRNPDVGWSSSPVGRRGGQQIIRLSDSAIMGTVVHECFHTLGVLHEQSRCDRDSHVTINYAHITDGFDGNFDRFCEGFQDYFDYDYDSLMHYGGSAFSKNGKPTIVPRRAGVTIGQRAGLSIGDRLTIAEMYSRFTGKGHTGVWRAGSGRYGLWANATWESFVSRWQQWASEGLRLVDIDVSTVASGTRYSGVFLPGTGAYGLWANATWASFVAKWQEWSAQGLRLVDLSVHGSGGSARYSGAFLPGSGAHGLWVNATWPSFVATWQEWAGQGLRLVDIDVRHTDGQTLYSGVWLPGSGGYALWANATWASFVSQWQQYAGQGLRLVDIDVHVSGSGTRYSGVWLPGTDGYYLWANAPWEAFRARWQDNAAKGLRLVDYELTIQEGAADLDSAGLPVTASMADEAFGGLFEEDGSPLEEAATAPERSTVVVKPQVTATGQGGLVPAGTSDGETVSTGPDGEAVQDDGAGVGGLVLAGERNVLARADDGSSADEPDGVGGMVSGSSAAELTVSTPDQVDAGDAAGAGDGSEGRGGLVTQRHPAPARSR